MNNEQALNFLNAHQPLPPTNRMESALLLKFDEVRKFFLRYPDEQCVRLFLGAFGEGDGHGIYQLVEDVISRYSEALIVKELLFGLQSERSATRHWCAQIAASHPDASLREPLLSMLSRDSVDERVAAVTALEQLIDADVRAALRRRLDLEPNSNVRKLIKDVLSD